MARARLCRQSVGLVDVLDGAVSRVIGALAVVADGGAPVVRLAGKRSLTLVRIVRAGNPLTVRFEGPAARTERLLEDGFLSSSGAREHGRRPGGLVWERVCLTPQ